MGRDGCEGMAAIQIAGGTTYAQDEASCVVYGMPKEAVQKGLAQQVLPPAEIAKRLIESAKQP
jgi:two-component system chemotaxis response regulator CheB